MNPEAVRQAILEMRIAVLKAIATKRGYSVGMGDLRSLAVRLQDREVVLEIRRRQPAQGWWRTLFGIGGQVK